MIIRPKTAYYKATAALRRSAGFRFVSLYSPTPERTFETAGAVRQGDPIAPWSRLPGAPPAGTKGPRLGEAVQLSSAMQGQPPKEWKVFRSGPDSYRAYVLDGGRWTPHREPEGLEFTVRPGMPLALAEAVDILNAAATLTRHRVMAALSGPGVPAEIDGQQCLRFGAHLEEGSFHWITFYLATGHFARITSSGPGGGSQVTLTQVGEPVEISDPAD